MPPEERCDKHLKGNDVITFSKASAILNQTPHLDALVIKVVMERIKVRQVYVNTDAVVNVMYLSCFQKMRLDPPPPPQPPAMYTSAIIHPMRNSTKRHNSGVYQVWFYPCQLTTMVNFYVVDSPPAYNIILGRDWLIPNKLFV